MLYNKVDQLYVSVCIYSRSSLLTQTGKNLPTMQETWVQSLGWEDLLEKRMAMYTSILPGEFYGQRSLVGYTPWGRKESDMTEQLTNVYPVPLEPPSHSSRSSEHWAELPLLYSSFPLAIYFTPGSVYIRGFPGGTSVKNLSASAGDVRDMGLIPGLERSPGEGDGKPLQYSCLENPMDRGA